MNSSRLHLLWIAGILLSLIVSVNEARSPQLHVPAGFSVQTYASGLKGVRLMALAPNGDLFVSETRAGRVLVLPDRNHDGRPDRVLTFAAGLNRPHGLAFHGGYLYVANTNAALRFAYQSGDLKARTRGVRLVSLPSGGEHFTRTLVFGSDDLMYVSTGSSCNVCEESNPQRASVWVYDANGQHGRRFASGLRNAVGLTWFQGQLYASANGRDYIGDNLPPEASYKLKSGGFYGWPYCYPQANGLQVFDARFGKQNPKICNAAQKPFATITAHSAPLGLRFYTGSNFPASYQGMLFVALHGSMNRSSKSGYKVIALNPKTGQSQDFLKGFLAGQTTLGRPVDVIVSADSALLVSDDFNGAIYRISHTKN